MLACNPTACFAPRALLPSLALRRTVIPSPNEGGELGVCRGPTAGTPCRAPTAADCRDGVEDAGRGGDSEDGRGGELAAASCCGWLRLADGVRLALGRACASWPLVSASGPSCFEQVASKKSASSPSISSSSSSSSCSFSEEKACAAAPRTPAEAFEGVAGEPGADFVVLPAL